jgi:signal transduction histidine kinase
MMLDARTFVFIITLSTILIALGLALVARGPLGKVTGISRWAMATALHSLGWIFTGLLRGKIPDLASIVIGNGLIVFSVVFYMFIIADFLQQAIDRRPWVGMLGLLSLGLAYFTSYQNDVAIRTALISFCLALIAFQSVRLLLLNRFNLLPSNRFMAGLYAFCGAFMLLRVFYFLFISPEPDQQPFSGNGFKDASLIIFYLFSVLLPFGFVLMCNDRYVIQHNRAEKELLQKTHLFERLSSLVPGTIYQYQRFPDGRTCFPFASAGIERIYEVRADEVTQDAFMILQRIHVDDRDEVIASIRRSAETLETWRAQYRVVLPRQGLRWLVGQAQPERLADGSVLWHGYIADFTEQTMVEAKQKELEREVLQSYHALEASEQRLRRLMNSSLIGMMQGNATGVLIEANDVLLQLLGIQRTAIERAEINWFELSNPPELTRQINAIRGLDQVESVPPFETHLLDREGRQIPIMFGVSKLADSENEWVGFVLDLREQKRIDHLKSEFISIVSHELRTPLTSIRGAMGLLESGVVGELPAKALHLVQIAHKNSQRLTALVNDILDMEKLATGQMVLNMREINLCELLPQALDANAPYAETYRVRYQLQTELSHAMVLADGDRLMQVMANILSNAAKFSSEGDVVEVRLITKDDQYVIEVEDHGRGIPSDFHDRIFGKFAQATDSSTRQKEGAGLGLHISKTLVEKMLGRIGFSSEEKVRTVFWVSLPQL